MPATIPLSISPSKKAQTKKPLYIVALIAIVGLAAWANSGWTGSTSTTAECAITAALRLAVGTMNLEGTNQAVDSASAAKLLPLWQLLAQLENSGTATPQEITAVVDEIKLNMTSAQVNAIGAMSISPAELGLVASDAGSSAGSANGNSAQVAAAGLDPMMGGILSSGPMDGGGLRPSGSTSTSKSSGSSTAVPSVITKVIELLQSKAQS